MGFYRGLDLLSSNTFVGVIDNEGKRVWKTKRKNDPGLISSTLKPLKKDIVGIVVESTYNRYSLVDFLMGEGYHVHLANPFGIQQYSGLKHRDDEDDAFWLAEMLRLRYCLRDRPVFVLIR